MHNYYINYYINNRIDNLWTWSLLYLYDLVELQQKTNLIKYSRIKSQFRSSDNSLLNNIQNLFGLNSKARWSCHNLAANYVNLSNILHIIHDWKPTLYYGKGNYHLTSSKNQHSVKTINNSVMWYKTNRSSLSIIGSVSYANIIRHL